jgi:hypothetical protein
MSYGTRYVTPMQLAQPVVHERSKKAGVHAVQYAPRVLCVYHGND